mgnify:CR=1 FL=1
MLGLGDVSMYGTDLDYCYGFNTIAYNALRLRIMQVNI